MTDTRAWLEGLGLVQYAGAFEQNDIDTALLADLTDDDLRNIGVASAGHRVKLRKAIADLDGGAPASPPSPAPEAPAAPDAERRQLTVMFCDMVGSTAMSRKLDPEELREVMRAYQDASAGAIERFDGYIAQTLGDGLMVYFGYPTAHEDDAQRAVRAGLDIVGRIVAVNEDMSARHGVSVAVRVGVQTGLVVAGEVGGADTRGDKAVVGETPNVAARLQNLAEPNTVVIGPLTNQLIQGQFDCEDLGTREIKGVAHRVHVHRVRGDAAAESRFEAAHGAGLTPLVGREQEIALLVERWAMAKEGEGQVALLSGEAGIGKSRVAQVLRERVADEPHIRLRYQCSPYYTNSAFHPFISQIERAAGFAPDDAPEARLDKLDTLLKRSGASGQEVSLIAAMLSLPIDRYPPLNLEPVKQKELTLAALADQLVNLARAEPALMIFEDAHWIDPTSLEALGVIIDRIQDSRVLLVITYRPEFEPPWTGHGHVVAQSLSRLSRRQGANMVAKVTGGKALPDEVLDQIVAKTDGVPLFVEELTKTVLEAGFLKKTDDAYLLDGPLPPLAIPATLQDSLAARLDRLSPVKEIAQIGACLGREFSYQLLAAVAPLHDNELQDALQQLVNSELIFRRGTPPEATYSFKHALVQDAAYESLLKSKRQQLHTTIARTLEERFADRLASEPELAAHHYTSAGLNEKAVPYWLAAGQQAIRRFANKETDAHLTKGVELLKTLPESRERDQQELAFQTTLGFARINYKSYGTEECGQTYARAWELCERVGDASQVLPVLFGLWLFYVVRGDYPTSGDMADQCLAWAEDAGDTGGMVLGNVLKGGTLLFLGELSAARDHL